MFVFSSNMKLVAIKVGCFFPSCPGSIPWMCPANECSSVWILMCLKTRRRFSVRGSLAVLED